jgi:hypothetical protein
VTGGCACGALRYRLASEPLFVHCCHCLNCQRQTGSAFVINLLIEADRVQLVAGTPHRVHWVALPPDTPAFDVYYDPRALWPAASLRRIEAVLPGFP